MFRLVFYCSSDFLCLIVFACLFVRLDAAGRALSYLQNKGGSPLQFQFVPGLEVPLVTNYSLQRHNHGSGVP